NSRQVRTRPTGCGEERVGDVAPTYGGSCGAGEERVGGVAPTYGGSPGPLRSGGAGGPDPQGAAHGCAAFSAEAGCLLGKSRRLREPDAKRRARRRGVLSLRQVSLHKQRKVARAVTARKLLILVSAERQADKTRPTGCGEERVGGVAPTYGGFCGAGRRASRGRSPDLRHGRARRRHPVASQQARSEERRVGGGGGCCCA